MSPVKVAAVQFMRGCDNGTSDVATSRVSRVNRAAPRPLVGCWVRQRVCARQRCTVGSALRAGATRRQLCVPPQRAGACFVQHALTSFGRRSRRRDRWQLTVTRHGGRRVHTSLSTLDAPACSPVPAVRDGHQTKLDGQGRTASGFTCPAGTRSARPADLGWLAVPQLQARTYSHV